MKYYLYLKLKINPYRLSDNIVESTKRLMVYLFDYKDPLIENKKTIEELTKTINRQYKELCDLK